MADGRRNNGARKGENRGQGRKPKLEEFKKLDAMDKIANPEQAFQRVWDLTGSADEKIALQALKLWIEHRTGKPKETIDKTTNATVTNIPISHWAMKTEDGSKA